MYPATGPLPEFPPEGIAVRRDTDNPSPWKWRTMTARNDGGTARRVAPGPRRRAVEAWTSLGRGWQAVVLGLAIVTVQFLVQSV